MEGILSAKSRVHRHALHRRRRPTNHVSVTSAVGIAGATRWTAACRAATVRDSKRELVVGHDSTTSKRSSSVPFSQPAPVVSNP
jgi:hypothetical protein